jgi:hypothetical protein
MELGPSFHGLPLAASALLRGRTLTVTEIFSIFFVFLPVQKTQSKKLAFRILSLRSPQSTTGKLQIQKRESKQQQLRLRNLNCNETLRSSSFAAFFSRAARSDAGRDAGGDTGPASATAVPNYRSCQLRQSLRQVGYCRSGSSGTALNLFLIMR